MVEVMVPPISDMARPWKMGVEQHHNGTQHHTARREYNRCRTHGSGFDDRLLERNAVFQPDIDKIDEQYGIAHHDACESDETDHRRSAEVSSITQCPKMIPISDKGIAASCTNGVMKFWNQPTMSMYMMTSTKRKASPKSRNTS